MFFKPKGYTFYAENAESCCMVLVRTKVYGREALEVVPVIPSLADRIALELNPDDDYFDNIVERMSWFGSYYPLEHNIVGCVLWTENDLKVKPDQSGVLGPLLVELDVREAENARLYEPYVKLIMSLYGDFFWFMRKKCVYTPTKPKLVDALLRDTDNVLRSFLKPFNENTQHYGSVLVGKLRDVEWLDKDRGYDLAPVWGIPYFGYYSGPGWCLQYTAKEVVAALRWVRQVKPDLLAHYGISGYEIYRAEELYFAWLQRDLSGSWETYNSRPPFIAKGNGHIWCTGEQLLAIKNGTKHIVPMELLEEDLLVSKYCLPQTTPTFIYR